MKAKELYELHHTIDLGIVTKDDCIKMMEAYHQSRVNAISDDDISKTCHLFALPSQAIKWFKNELLKQ